MPDRTLPGIQSLQHVVVLMMENRSFRSHAQRYRDARAIPTTASVAPILCSRGTGRRAPILQPRSILLCWVDGSSPPSLF
jgi:phospholipase C